MDKTVPAMPELKELDPLYSDGQEGLEIVKALLERLEEKNGYYDYSERPNEEALAAVKKAQRGMERADKAIDGLYCKAHNAIKAGQGASTEAWDFPVELLFPAQSVKALLDAIERKIWSCVSMLRQSASAMAVPTVELACRDLTAAQTLCTIAENYTADMEKKLEAVT